MDSNNISTDKFDITSILVTLLVGVIIGLIIGNYIIKPKIYHGPDSNDIKKEIHEDSNGQYKWDTVITICPLGTIPHK
jgi:hypothetical protein